MSRSAVLMVNLVFTILSVTFAFLFSSCKSTPGTIIDEQFLSPPTVFVSVGVLRQPHGIAIDASGKIWVADARAGKLRRFSPDGALRDSVVGFQFPTGMGLDRSNNSILVIDGFSVSRINPQTLHTSIITSLGGTTVDGSSVFDVNTRSTSASAIDVLELGDIDGSLTGDIFVSASGTPQNFVIRIRGGIASAVAGSRLALQNSTDHRPHFLAVDAFGTVYTSFVLGPGTPVVRAYSYSQSNSDLSHVLSEPSITRFARGGGIDASGNLYIADPATQELIIVSTMFKRTISRYAIPDVGGYAMIPRDAAATDQAVYVVVTDRLGTEAGAVLRYAKISR